MSDNPIKDRQQVSARNKNIIIMVLAVISGVLLACLLFRGCGPKEPPKGGTIIVDPVSTEPPTKGDDSRVDPSRTPGDVDRIPDKRIVKSTFVMSGQGYHAKWGKGLKAGFRQKGEFVAEANIVERKKLGNGRFKVVEDRKFLTARETLEIGGADYFLALDTLPIDGLASALEKTGKVVNTVSDFLISTGVGAAYGGALKTGASIAEIIGSGLRRFKIENNGKELKEFGIDVSKSAGNEVEAFINDNSLKPKEIETIVRNVEGRTYRFTYIQEGSGRPMNVTAERLVDGKPQPVETAEEVWILCRCNAFIDAEFLKDGGEKTPQPGVPWDVDARSVAGILGLDGHCDGKLRCWRDADDAADGPGLWRFNINSAELDVVDNRKQKLGKISVGGGKANVYVDGRTLHDITIKGKGKISRISKYSILFIPFNERFVGDCEFVGNMTTEVKK